MKRVAGLFILTTLLCVLGCGPAFWGPGVRGATMWGFGLPLMGPGFQGWFFWLIIIGLIVLAYQLGKRSATGTRGNEIILNRLNELETEIQMLKQQIKE